jgi:hypothetical protein
MGNTTGIGRQLVVKVSDETQLMCRMAVSQSNSFQLRDTFLWTKNW